MKEHQVSKPMIIQADRLADGLSSQSKSDQGILVEDGLIIAVGDKAMIQKQAPPDSEVIDLGPACITPGLIDCHSHLSLSADGRNYAQMFAEPDETMILAGVMNLRLHLSAGVTTMRENGARNRIGFTLKEGLRRGYFPGPRLLVCGRTITCSGGHFHMCNEVADGEKEMRASVRRLVHEGADFIKIMTSGGDTKGTISELATYTTKELKAAIEEAHHFNLLTSAHCRATQSMYRTAEAGIDLIDHSEFLDTDGKIRFDPKLADMMAASGTWVCPTIQTMINYPQMLKLGDQRDAGTISKEQEMELQRLETYAEQFLDVVRRMLDHNLGDRIVTGTDAGVFYITYGHLDHEIQLLVRVGFTPAEALIAATRKSAEAIGLVDKIGTIEKGKIADLVAFEDDPTIDVSASSRVVAVFQEGQRVA